jgi:hypothetical protein
MLSLAILRSRVDYVPKAKNSLQAIAIHDAMLDSF